MKKINRMSLLMIFIMGVAIFVVGFTLYNYFFTGSEHIIEDKIIDAWYTEESIQLNEVEHWWITIDFEDSIPQMYFFKSDNIIVNNGKQKADDVWDKIEPLIGSNVRFEYYIEHQGNELDYFKGISLKNPELR